MTRLITGTSSGFGKELAEHWPAAERWPRQEVGYPLTGIIVHVACDSAKSFDAHNILDYVKSHIDLTEQMSFCHEGPFIFLSSVDVYPKGTKEVFTEESPFSLESPCSFYGALKLAAEAIVRRNCKKHLILRLPTMLGPHQRPNAITRCIDGQGRLTLHYESTFNCVLTKDVIAFIDFAIKERITGTFNFGSTDMVELAEIATADTHFGQFFYECPKISSEKVYSIFPRLKKSTLEVIQQFKKEKDLWK